MDHVRTHLWVGGKAASAGSTSFEEFEDGYDSLTQRTEPIIANEGDREKE